jgi:hypothetical protein
MFQLFPFPGTLPLLPLRDVTPQVGELAILVGAGGARGTATSWTRTAEFPRPRSTAGIGIPARSRSAGGRTSSAELPPSSERRPSSPSTTRSRSFCQKPRHQTAIREGHSSSPTRWEPNSRASSTRSDPLRASPPGLRSIQTRPLPPGSMCAGTKSTLSSRYRSPCTVYRSAWGCSCCWRAGAGPGPRAAGQRPGRRQNSAMFRAVSRLISGQAMGKISVPCIVPITWRQRASTPSRSSSR